MSNPIHEELQQREIVFSGRVQGVGFRYTARLLASQFEVTGFVRNLPDGRVQMVVEGQAEEIDRFCDSLADRMKHYIENVQEVTRTASLRFQAFEVRH